MWCCKCTSQNSHTIVSPIIGWICRMFELHGHRKTLFASTYIHIILPFCMILIMQARNITKNQATLLSKSEHAWKSELGHMLVIFYYSLCQASGRAGGWMESTWCIEKCDLWWRQKRRACKNMETKSLHTMRAVLRTWKRRKKRHRLFSAECVWYL